MKRKIKLQVTSIYVFIYQSNDLSNLFSTFWNTVCLFHACISYKDRRQRTTQWQALLSSERKINMIGGGLSIWYLNILRGEIFVKYQDRLFRSIFEAREHRILRSGWYYTFMLVGQDYRSKIGFSGPISVGRAMTFPQQLLSFGYLARRIWYLNTSKDSSETFKFASWHWICLIVDILQSQVVDNLAIICTHTTRLINMSNHAN